MGNKKEPDPIPGIKDVASALIKDIEQRAEIGKKSTASD